MADNLFGDEFAFTSASWARPIKPLTFEAMETLARYLRTMRGCEISRNLEAIIQEDRPDFSLFAGDTILLPQEYYARLTRDEGPLHPGIAASPDPAETELVALQPRKMGITSGTDQRLPVRLHRR